MPVLFLRGGAELGRSLLWALPVFRVLTDPPPPREVTLVVVLPRPVVALVVSITDVVYGL